MRGGKACHTLYKELLEVLPLFLRSKPSCEAGRLTSLEEEAGRGVN